MLQINHAFLEVSASFSNEILMRVMLKGVPEISYVHFGIHITGKSKSEILQTLFSSTRILRAAKS